MKKIKLLAKIGGGGNLRLLPQAFWGYTLAEVIIVMLIIAVIVSVTIGITKAKLDNVLSYTYYNGYSTLREITTEMLSNWDPKDPEYKQALNSEETHKLAQIDFSNGLQNPILTIKDRLLSIYRDLWLQSVLASQFTFEDGDHNCLRIEFGGGSYRQYCCPKPTRPEYLGGARRPSYNCVVDCWDGSTASSYSLCPTQEVTCWDGSKAPNDASCPSHITCWNGEWKHNTSECPKADCWNGTQANTPSDCPPKVGCWDGSYATSESNCPDSVTCWDGSKKYNWSQCPACTNKPNPLPCGQGWDEHTCQLTGSVKTCPSGQHLNSGCECVADCPTNLTPCQQCSNETGVISQNPDINRTCTDETYEWNEDQCKCVQSPRTLPRKGENFCKLFERHSNIMGNTDVCSGSVVSDGTIDFTGKKADITLGNGIRFYNMHRDATEIDVLAGNIQGGAYEGVPNTNSYGYTVYVDIDGAKGDSQLWSDVYPFYITLSGKIIPAYDKANPGVSGGDSTHHLQVSVQYEDYSSGKRRMKWLSKSTSFKEGACLSGYIGDATPYCKDSGAVTKLSECTTDSNSMCHLKHIQPVKFFF